MVMREVFSPEQLIELFDLAQVGKAAARFDQQKLDWLNGHWLREAKAADLIDEVSRLLAVDMSDGPDLEPVITSLQRSAQRILSIWLKVPASFMLCQANIRKKQLKRILETQPGHCWICLLRRWKLCRSGRVKRHTI